MALKLPADYVLGTHTAEGDRLALQHSLWIDEARAAWNQCGIRKGSRVVDVGCGPGLATVALLEAVGETGTVSGIEISARFAQQARARCEAAGRSDCEILQCDLMTDSMPPHFRHAFDAVWMRWVAMFVRDPKKLISQLSDLLAPNGVVALHEYYAYDAYSLLGGGARVREFVQFAMASFAKEGGDASIARELPQMLVDQGFEVVSMRPIARAARPHEPLWHWPAGFIRTYSPTLVKLGYADEQWLAAIEAELRAAEANPASVLIAPSVLEIIARKR
ncbi:MAG: class I SAM-dependent methyltransferase [Phycisphaerales bacterium]|nr:class I SAM-dependent methyltransferase [Phycisphaerales bacterium]